MIIGILGAGSWGSALANLLAGNGHDVTVWSIDEKEIEMLNTYREQRDRLPGVHLNETITFTTDLEQTIKGKNDRLCSSVPIYPEHSKEDRAFHYKRSVDRQCQQGH